MFVCRFAEKKYFVVDSGEKKLCTSRPWDFAWCTDLAFVYMQLCRRVLFFKNLTRHEICWMLDDDGIFVSKTLYNNFVFAELVQ